MRGHEKEVKGRTMFDLVVASNKGYLRVPSQDVQRAVRRTRKERNEYELTLEYLSSLPPAHAGTAVRDELRLARAAGLAARSRRPVMLVDDQQESVVVHLDEARRRVAFVLPQTFASLLGLVTS